VIDERLKGFNFELDVSYIYSSAYVSAQYVKNNLFKKKSSD